MQLTTLNLDENREMYCTPPGLAAQVCLILSDALLAWEQPLTPEYTAQILQFVNTAPAWYPAALAAVQVYGRQTYGEEPLAAGIRLMNIFVLFEQGAAPLFGLQWRTEFDVEHGCGMQMDGATHQILKTGPADIAFC